MNSDMLRMIGAAAIVWFALNGLPGGGIAPVIPSGSYSGPLTSLHAASAEMEPGDKAGLSAAMSSAAKMLRDDRAGLLKTTEDLQEFVRGTTAYGYSSFSLKKYGAVADAVQAELEKAVGSDIKPVDSSMRESVAAALEEIGRAVR